MPITKPTQKATTRRHTSNGHHYTPADYRVDIVEMRVLFVSDEEL